MTLQWHGPDIVDRVKKASRQGIDDTLNDAVPEAKERTPVVTGLLQGSIQARPATIRGDNISGLWGSFDVEYARVVEEGAQNRPARRMLQQAADENYPNLRDNILRRYRNA